MSIDFPKNWVISSTQSINYTVSYAPNLFDPTNLLLIDSRDKVRRLVFVDTNVLNIYGEEITNYFTINAPGSKIVGVLANEVTKTLDNVLTLVEDLENFGILRRSEPVIAIGGGALLDLVGFACSIYRRGIPYVRVPTTLLSIVDVSVAIKTGINHLSRRNRLGTYYPPESVFLNRKFISTQSNREISNGLGEILKLGIIDDLHLFTLLEENADLLIAEKFQFGAVPVRVINKAISVMINNLQNNLWEDNLCRAVDFGHTFSPLIELNLLPSLLHGEAVALDCIFSSCISFHRGSITRQELNRIYEVARSLGLPTDCESFLDINQLESALSDTVKHRNGNQNLPIPDGIGAHKFINDLSPADLVAAIDVFRRLSEGL